MSQQALTVRTISSLTSRGTVHLQLFLTNVSKGLKGLSDLVEREYGKEGKLVRPTNGQQVLANAKMVNAGRLWPQLVESGFIFYDAYREPWQTDGMMVTLVFCRPEVAVEGQDPNLISPAALRAVNELIDKTWQYVHVWENPEGSLSVIGITPRKDMNKPEAYLRIHADNLEILPSAKVEERVAVVV